MKLFFVTLNVYLNYMNQLIELLQKMSISRVVMKSIFNLGVYLLETSRFQKKPFECYTHVLTL